jgi:hypothetical protein
MYILQNGLKRVTSSAPTPTTTATSHQKIVSKPKQDQSYSEDNGEPDYIDIDLTNVRKVIAKRLTLSKVF